MKRIMILIAAGLLFLTVGVAALTAVQNPFPGETAAMECADDELEVLPISAGTAQQICDEKIKPTPTPTPPVAPSAVIAPYPDAPLCDDHDERTFHTLWNEVDGCHYDHEHGQPRPDWVFAAFGDYTEYTEYEIGYAWETPGENANKHPGYNFGGYRLDECKIDFAAGGVIAAWTEAHGMANHMGQQARVHSFSGAAELCNEDGYAGTILHTGGHADFGGLMCPYKQAWCEIDVYSKAPQAEMWQLGKPPYVGTAAGPGTGSFETWNSVVRSPSDAYVNAHQIYRFAFRIGDPYTGYTPDGEILEFGGNSSARYFYQYEITIPAELADPVSGLVNFDGYTDVHGVVDESCAAPGPNCVPLVIVDAVPGEYKTNATPVFGLRNFYEGDIYFNGESSGWIGGMN
jgi:hypothetical protein